MLNVRNELNVFFLIGVLSAILMAYPCHLFAEETLKFAMLPQMTNSQVDLKWRPLLQQVEKETNQKIEIIFPKDYDEYKSFCREGKINIAYSNPCVYVQIASEREKRRAGHVVFGVAESEKGKNDFYGLFIMRVDNQQIKTLSDIKGKKGCVVAWDSAGGFIFQQAYALSNGIDMKKDCNLMVAPDNRPENVVRAVLNHNADFGCIRNGLLSVLKERADLAQIQVLAKTDTYPAWVLSMDSRVEPETARKISQALLSLSENIVRQVELPGKVIKFSAITDEELAPVRAAMDKSKIAY